MRYGDNLLAYLAGADLSPIEVELANLVHRVLMASVRRQPSQNTTSLSFVPKEFRGVLDQFDRMHETRATSLRNFEKNINWKEIRLGNIANLRKQADCQRKIISRTNLIKIVCGLLGFIGGAGVVFCYTLPVPSLPLSFISTVLYLLGTGGIAAAVLEELLPIRERVQICQDLIEKDEKDFQSVGTWFKEIQLLLDVLSKQAELAGYDTTSGMTAEFRNFLHWVKSTDRHGEEYREKFKNNVALFRKLQNTKHSQFFNQLYIRKQFVLNCVAFIFFAILSVEMVAGLFGKKFSCILYGLGGIFNLASFFASYNNVNKGLTSHIEENIRDASNKLESEYFFVRDSFIDMNP